MIGIGYIDARCMQWGRWARRFIDGGMGYPHECAFVKIPGTTGNHGTSVDEAAYEIDRAVMSLPRDLRDAVVQCYLKGGTGEQKAKACGCQRDTYYERIHRAQRRIMEWLNDETAGVPHQAL